MPYVSDRWLGGTLTNFSTIRKRINRMKELEEVVAAEVLRKLDGIGSPEVFTDYLGGPDDETRVALLLERGGHLRIRFRVRQPVGRCRAQPE